MRGRLVARTWSYDPALYAPPRFRKACRYKAFIPDVLAGFNEPIQGQLVGLISDAEAAISRLNSGNTSALAPLARLLLRSESIASSKIEGMQILPHDLVRAEMKMQAGEKVSAVAREVISNIDAMELAIAQSTQVKEFKLEHIVDIHRALMANAHNSHIAGVIRAEQNWIGGNDYNPSGADFVPPPPEEVLRLLADLVKTMNQNYLPPIVQAALVHAQFETIHPFHDGNGRTGRALVHVVLRRRNLANTYVPPISIIFADNKKAYVRGLNSFRDGDLHGWLEIFLSASVKSADLATRYLGEVGMIQEEWRQVLKSKLNPRSDAVVWKIIELLPGYPVLNVSRTMELVGRSKAVVNQAMDKLEQSQIICRQTEIGRNRTWEAPTILNLLDNLGEGD